MTTPPDVSRTPLESQGGGFFSGNNRERPGASVPSHHALIKRWLWIGGGLSVGFAAILAAAYLEVASGGASGGPAVQGSLTQHRSAAPAFDFRALRVPRDRLLSGGPPKDGIPALTSPAVVPGDDPGAPDATDRVIGVTLEGRSRAYPLGVLNYHEIVNDRLGETPIAVTYCPLCDSALVFDRRTPQGEKEFGVSGLLYNSNVLMYDRSGGSADSLWSQLMATGISGAASGSELSTLPVVLTTWGAWKSRHPTSDVISTNTGHGRDYRRNPYEHYFAGPSLMFPAEPRDDRLPTKAKVVGLWTGDASLAAPASAFPDGVTASRVSVGGKQAVIEYDSQADTLRVLSADDGVQWMYSLWFAWYAFHPETEVYSPAPNRSPQ